ncbi:sulfotransferase 1C4-like isoform X1 [Tubulanus polymorphus]|uniref:sulfotransferase 1C4-like isoform X1 n=1 Tax=Tubulanus polymorphus TaxID=672921 RepID=UPI003DA47AF4
MSTNCTGTADDEQFSTLHQIPDQFEIVEHGFIGGYFTPPEILDKVRNYEVFEDDCFVASYPKTGTTLTQETVYLIYHNGNDEVARQKPIHERFPYIDTNELFPLAEKMPRPRLMKSHLPFDMFPIQAMGEKAKIIYVMRNPKDTLVSYYHFYKSCKSFGNFPGSWDDFFQLFLHKKLFCGDFYDHVLSWWNQRHRDNILFLKYEDMVTDPKSNILKICAFLGKTLSDDEIDNIVKQTSFEIMRDNPTTNFSQTHYQDNKICPFIRKGKIGDWKNFFTDEQCRIIDKIHEDRLAETGLSFQFE